MGLMTAVAAPLGFVVSGTEGLQCVIVAAAVCILSGAAVLAIQRLFPQPEFALLHVLGGFFLRMGVPLAACMAVYWRRGPLADAGFVFYLLAFYAASLTAGTLFGLPRAARPLSAR